MKVEATRSTEKSASNEKWLEARLRYLMFKTNRWQPPKQEGYIYRKENPQEKS
jgi:hypothetical protein